MTDAKIKALRDAYVAAQRAAYDAWNAYQAALEAEKDGAE